MKLVAVACLLFVALGCFAYDGEPTDTELVSWWAGLDRDSRMVELRKLDTVEHAEPILVEPEMLLVQTDSGMIGNSWSAPLGIKIGHLSYQVTLPQVVIQGAAPANPKKWFGIGVAVGVGASVGVAIAIFSAVQ